jgi:hypothetical protein
LLLCREAAVDHPLLGHLAKPLLDLLDHGPKLGHIAAALTTVMVTMTWLSQVVANCMLWAGMKPPSVIFITRASASVGLERARLA